ncbi:hypothetical protein FQR65_LT17114 [Abscondita terminalis]|nr:hypothetical protein FQR65_LT17114 [Abscondita terminalis]
MSQLSCRQSLRDIESNLESQQEKLYHLGAKRIARIGLNHSNTIPEFVALGDGIENDMVQGRTLKFPSGSIVVFDKGYIDYQWFAEMTQQNISFVTRLRPKTVYKVKSTHKVLACKGILADECIELSSKSMQKGVCTPSLT